ncbi:MAG: PilZ domain-containing protein [Candidatus Omnitrophica bacterium]|nr:PilZ domain-containing protein [Candidatus Omnitrophota bacterium]
MENKRKHPRSSFSEPVGYQRREDLPLEGSVAGDISQTGLKLSVNEFIPLNTILELQIQLPGQVQLVPAHAKVVWVREASHREDAWEIGLQLVSSENFSLAIREYVNRNRFESLS